MTLTTHLPAKLALRPFGLRRPKVSLGLLLSIGVLLFAGLAAVWPGLFTSHDPLAILPSAKLRGPDAVHWLGTDHLGRDMWSRILHGSRNSLTATGIAVAIGLVAGSAIGLISGMATPKLDAAIMRVVDVLLAIPNLLLSLAVVSVLGFGLVQVAVAVGVGTVGSFARIMRAEVLRQRHATFVEAAELLGASRTRLILLHILPHTAGPVAALATIEFGAAVLSVSALSFLGFGAPPPEMEWGLLIAEGRKYINVAWWLILFPALFIVATVLATNHLGHALEARHDRRR